jgi:hypothetical protein
MRRATLLSQRLKSVQYARWRIMEVPVTKERDRLEQMLKNQFDGGTVSQRDMITTLVQYDAAYATKVMARYTLASTIVAMISAISSAAAAYFAYAALHLPH